LWFTAFGMTDLVVALTLVALTGFQLINGATACFTCLDARLARVRIPRLVSLQRRLRQPGSAASCLPGRIVTDVISSWWHPAMVPMTLV